MNLKKRLKRQTRIREQRKIFIIVVEGQTEQRYFENFRNLAANVIVKVNRPKASDPGSALSKMEEQLEEFKAKKDLKPGDQAWLVFDQDQWGLSSIEAAWDWSVERKDRGVAFSRPQFELWLLLHFESATGVSTKSEVLHRLDVYIPGYTKGKQNQLPQDVESYRNAIENAKSKVTEIPESFSDTNDIAGAFTTVHFLVESILQAVEASEK